MIRVKKNKLLTGFLVLGLGLSLVACSSNEPEEKVEEKKIEETKAIEEKEEKVKIIRCKVKILDTLFYSCYSI